SNPGAQPNALALDPNNANVVYGGTALGVYKSLDGGTTWNAMNNGLNALNVRALALAPSQPATLYVGSVNLSDGFVTKLSATGNALAYSTYLGGINQDYPTGIAVDAAGNAYIGGGTLSVNFPGLNGFQTTLKGESDAFLAKLNPSGTAFVWASYLGGDGSESANDLAVNAAGNVFVAGITTSTNLPISKALQPVNRSMSPNPTEGFVTRFSTDGKTLDYSTYLGGVESDHANAIAVDGAGNTYVTGVTASRDFPLANAVQTLLGNKEQFLSLDAFVTKLSADGTSLLYSTFFGGSGSDQAFDLAVDSAGNAYVTGLTNSQDFPATPNALRNNNAVGLDGFIAKFTLNTDLALTLTDAPDPVMVGNLLIVTLTVTNNGPDVAAGVMLAVTLPVGVTFNAATSSQGACTNAAPLSCSLGALAPRATATATLTVTPTATGTITTRATVTSASPDLTTANNSATQETRVVNAPSIYGRVTAGGAGLNAVSVTLTGAQRPAAPTNPHGDYQFAELASGASYTVTPQRAGYVFNPPARSVANLTRDQRADFAAVACTFTLAARTQSFPATGGTGSVNVTATDAQCPWTARSTVPWITLQSAASGNGSTILRFTVAATVSAQQGSVIIGGQWFTVFQEFNACTTLRLGSSLATLTLPSGNYDARLWLLRDFNKDGRVDMAAVTSTGRYSVEVFVGLTEGGFKAPVTPLALTANGAAITGLAAADFNQDGNLDLVAMGGDAPGSGRIWTMIGNGTGDFAVPQPQTLAEAFYPTSLATGDFNGDNRPDLAFGTGAAPWGATVINNGSGGFGTPRGLPEGGNFFSSSIEVSDLNGDGNLDVVRGNGPGFNFYQGDG
ncbi:MAG: DUF11 domain-containing protein, partial [Acidobacteria bacterium]|nr:DUF11 domain-containing protein [Acidobacteriota bacterium]